MKHETRSHSAAELVSRNNDGAASDKDMGINDTVRTLDQILTSYGIQHVFEIYEGDHVNRVAARLESKVLPFFGTNLSFTKKKK